MRFSDFVTLQRGFDLPKTEMRQGTYPVVGSTSIIGHHDEFKVEPPGVVTGRSGSLGIVQYVAEKYWPHNTSLWVKDFKGNDPKFVYYCMQGMDFARFNAGAGVPTLNRNHLDSLEVEVPSLLIQRRIAGILSAYDELIENNQRRIRILEDMARSLYREWFVHFRYPGHESVPLVDSPLGQIPQGWEAIPFERLLASMTGGDWGSEQPAGRDTAEVGIVRGTDFDEVAYGGQLRVPVRYITPSSFTTRGLRAGDVVIENSINAKSRCIGTTLLVDNHVLNRLGRDAVAASFCKVFRLHDSRLAPLVHLHVRHLREDAKMEYYQNVAANGIGNFQAKKFAKEERLVLPSNEVMRVKLIEPIASLFNSVGVLASQLSNLRRTRDLLLPRLLSGNINLSHEVVVS